MTERRPRPNVARLSEAIQLGPGKDAQTGPRVRYGLILLIFMRALACVWIARGMYAWAEVLLRNGGNVAGTSLDGAAIFYCVADIIAGVGLWMGTSWGGILWIFAASIGLAATLASPDKSFTRHLAFGADVILIVCYFTLSWYAARERDE